MHPGTEPPFAVGAELVEFDRRARAIYDTTPADELVGRADPGWGAPLDRLYGDAEGLHLDTSAGAPPRDVAGLAADPLVELGTLTDGLGETVLAASALEVGRDFDFGLESSALLPLPDGELLDGSGLDWTFDGPS